MRIGLVRAIGAPAQSGPTDQGPFEVALDELAVPGVRPPPPAKPCPKGTDVIECFRAAFQRRVMPRPPTRNRMVSVLPLRTAFWF